MIVSTYVFHLTFETENKGNTIFFSTVVDIAQKIESFIFVKQNSCVQSVLLFNIVP